MRCSSCQKGLELLPQPAAPHRLSWDYMKTITNFCIYFYNESELDFISSCYCFAGLTQITLCSYTVGVDLFFICFQSFSYFTKIKVVSLWESRRPYTRTSCAGWDEDESQTGIIAAVCVWASSHMGSSSRRRFFSLCWLRSFFAPLTCIWLVVVFVLLSILGFSWLTNGYFKNKQTD